MSRFLRPPAVFWVLGISIFTLCAGIAFFFKSRQPPEITLASCNTTAGYLNHSEKTFGPCGSDICSGETSGRPIYSCHNGATTSTCIPDDTCSENPTYTNKYGLLNTRAGLTCPSEALFGCSCSSGPGADDLLIVNPGGTCPTRYCYIYNPNDSNCFKVVSYLGDTCPQNRYYFDTSPECTNFFAGLTPDQLASVLATANQPGGLPGVSGASGPIKVIDPSQSGTTYVPGEGDATAYPTSPMGKLFYQVAGLLPTKTLPAAVVNNLPVSSEEKILLVGIDPANPNYTTITSPQSGQTLSGTVNIDGGAVHPDFQYYFLEYGPDPNPANQWTKITQNIYQSAFDTTLGSWNTSSLSPGTYQLRLVMDLSKTRHHVRYVTVGNLQKK